ncbi:MAG: glycoside hydrolase family 3 protein, partial [bacterium]|nr:glycoside hydrolase family 3 protein [bacterium]
MHSLHPFHWFSLLFISVVLIGPQAGAQTEPYLRPDLPIGQRLEDLMSRMTIEEKVGQLVHLRGLGSVAERSELITRLAYVDAEASSEADADVLADYVRNGRVGSMLQVSGLAEANALQKLVMKSRLRIPLLIGTDATHGNGYTRDQATIFPSPLGMACSFDDELLRRVARVTAVEMRAVGYQWNFSPYPAVSRDARWGRIAESFGEDPLVNGRMGAAMVKGYQEGGPRDTLVAACPKVWVGEGQPLWNGLNHSPLQTSERELHTTFLPPFHASFMAGAYTTMAAHHEIGGVPCHANVKLNRDLLKGEWGFRGFMISDWNDVDRL